MRVDAGSLATMAREHLQLVFPIQSSGLHPIDPGIEKCP